MSTIGIIPVRVQSSRFPNKTFALLDNKPLIQWTVEQARQSKLDDFFVVSSSDKVREWCIAHHVKYIFRVAGFESSYASIVETINWLNERGFEHRLKYDIQILLQVTNPLRTVEDIDKAIDTLVELQHANSLCTVVDVGEVHPYRMYLETLGKGLKPLFDNIKQQLNTQQLPKIWLRDGGIYAWKTKAFTGETLLPPRLIGQSVEQERSIRIDTPRDLERAQKVLDLVRATRYP